MKVDLAENWWLEKGQYCDQDTKLFPKEVVKEAYTAGFNLGLILGRPQRKEKKNEAI